ncbi:uncharacterized protein LOC109832746 isoform X2 [Asparagus officinalis]|uniref:uncharacterized protein LOC109832746 isoform X1 n=1 Tax=Asparagus officinalis TaxID=4686 RepID=UPI00098E84F6|nr:uncharacterized protein LOC109832746 isoform X1 [Asparagus officinalis]XP_020255744.1 uncharacterized protein LOC109832746 isoform X2 [Asparagus officinalis]
MTNKSSTKSRQRQNQRSKMKMELLSSASFKIIDMRVSYRWFYCDCCTHVLQEGHVTGRAADMITAANTAAEVALRLVRPGKKLMDKLQACGTLRANDEGRHLLCLQMIGMVTMFSILEKISRLDMSSENRDVNEVVEISPSQGVGFWSENVELYFIDLMVEEVKKGNRHTTTFTRSSWKFMEHELKKKTGREYTHDQMKNKFNQLRQRWRNLKSLLTDTAVGYTVSTGQISATEDVWTKLYATHKYARYFRRKGCKGYDKLCIIFGDTTATGDHAHPSTKSPTISEDDNGEEGEDEEDVESSRAKKKAKVANKRVPLNQQIQLAMVEALTSMGENSRKKMELRERKMSSTTADSHVSGGRGRNSEEEQGMVQCITALSALPDVDSTQFSKAAHILHDDASWRTMFLAMPSERKKDWVLKLP